MNHGLDPSSQNQFAFRQGKGNSDRSARLDHIQTRKMRQGALFSEAWS